MPDFPTIRGGPSQTASTPTTSAGIVLTADASNHTKGAWVELIASTTYASSWLLFSTVIAGTGLGQTYLVDIAVGASTAEQLIIPNLHAFMRFVPAGTRISARCQSSAGTSTLGVLATIIASPMESTPGYSRFEAAGVVTATSRSTLLNDPGTVAHTDGTWTELIASTGFPYRWMCIAFSNPNDTAWAGGAATHLVDIGVGAGGSEVELISDIPTGGQSSDDNVNPATYCFPCSVGQGQRIVARHRCSSITGNDRRLNATVYGAG
jgi:hypothetical protein